MLNRSADKCLYRTLVEFELVVTYLGSLPNLFEFTSYLPRLLTLKHYTASRFGLFLCAPLSHGAEKILQVSTWEATLPM